MTIDQFCAHSHTKYCDGKHTPEEMVQAAISLGFVSLGFSGHGYAPHDPYCMSPETEADYRREILRLRRAYGGQLEILLGQEHDALSPNSDYPYDYRIESVHYIWTDGIYCPVDWSADRMTEAVRDHFGGDVYAYSKTYFETCAEAYLRTDAQIAGHLDLIAKFNENNAMFDGNDPRFLKPAMEALTCAVERGLVVEVNTGAMAKGYRTAPYPSVPLLRHLRELGGEVMVNSDCHDRAFLTCGYQEAARLLRSCGFDHAVALRANGWQDISLL